VGGLNLFIYLKLLGLDELTDTYLGAMETLLPLSTFMGIDMAFAIGVLELYVFPKWKHFTFLKFIVYKYVLLILTIVILSLLIYIGSQYLNFNKSVSEAVSNIPTVLASGFFLSGIIYTLLFSIFFNVLRTIFQYLGPQAVASALLGRYQNPAEEDLTFIFIDLKSSTTIAEQLGHVRYSLFIDRCFQKLTESIRAYDASVYQFVGDEAVLLWRTKDVRSTIAPVHLYYDFVNRLIDEREYFLSEFKTTPHFRASIHSGMVTVTEIHSVKTDIVYHGDVLNTCARVMALCSKLDKDLLVSAIVASWLKDHRVYSAALIDDIRLRGKENATSVYELKPK
jgi:adenylate cyclase